MVPTEGLEPPHLAAHGPEPCASTNSATWALILLNNSAIIAKEEVLRQMSLHSLLHINPGLTLPASPAFFNVVAARDRDYRAIAGHVKYVLRKCLNRRAGPARVR